MQSSRDPAYVKNLRKIDLDPLHVYSCGPEAIQKAFGRFGIYMSLSAISHIMQSGKSCSNLVRDLMSVFERDARKITFPYELKEILKKNGFTIVNIKGLEDLDIHKDTALVLIKRNGELNYHWMCFPVDKNIKTFFGKHTIIKEIYLIKN